METSAFPSGTARWTPQFAKRAFRFLSRNGRYFKPISTSRFADTPLPKSAFFPRSLRLRASSRPQPQVTTATKRSAAIR